MSQSQPVLKRQAAQQTPRHTSVASMSVGDSNDLESGSVRSEALPSMYGIWATKRMARTFLSRVRRPRFSQLTQLSSRSSSKVPGSHPPPREPTYRLEPREKFSRDKVSALLLEVLSARLATVTYDPVVCPAISKALTDEIREKVKRLQYDRCKIVCMVTLGEKQLQGFRVSSRCVWDADRDTSATANWENATLFCTATVYGIYHE